ncbi:6-phosphogluconolactonase [Phytophthora pseudosyringae]|uniref:6-phosphogluconolactonase n=1 Tax=Phytophthora pseudosyringae TaxID=221518 RepID=A0A8T1VNQ5_9STRA|nr:6-phosphogluconolactonase [Phytophthora pseudosyringae]
MRLLYAGLALLSLLGAFGPTALLSQCALQSSFQTPTNGNVRQVVNVIVAGATGDLAAKYLWVAMFRLALEGKASSGRMFRFFAGASDTVERGRIWHKKFFNEVFAERVCGPLGGEDSTVQIECREFLETEFKQSVQYAPLRTERHYRELGRRLKEMNKQEEGRMSCEMIHRYLRPKQEETGSADPFLRVVVEKPFGRDLQSAHELATRLRAIFRKDELYVMDHYAGKPVVHALGDYFQLNAAALHPLWNSEHIQDIHIEMTETSTLQNRVHYFDSAGIIRDIMVNHLQSLLSVAVVPSFDPAIYTTPISSNEFARRIHEAQLRVIKALEVPREQPQESIFVAQYDEYAVHYRAEMDESLAKNDHFTPTAAMIELTSSLHEWRNTTFRLAAAKATAARLLTITVSFRNGVFPSTEVESCTFTVIIQRALNADSHHSHRMEWSCDISKLLPQLQLPSGWERLNSDDNRVLTPTKADQIQLERGSEAEVWELGDEPSAYDILLREIASGATEHFADLDEVEAAWELWTPIVNAAEALTSESSAELNSNDHLETERSSNGQLKQASYRAGTSPWDQIYSTSRHGDPSPTPREEL